MHKRKLGRQGLEVSALGLGCMGMSFAYGHPEDAASIRVLRHTLDVGINFWDTAEMYGPFSNEELLGRMLKEVPRQRLIIATKFAWRFGPHGEQLALDSSPAQIRRSLEGSLRRLGTDHIDLYYQHRLDPATPIEETVRALDQLVRHGHVRYVGVSNWAAWQIVKALGIAERLGLARFESLQAYYTVAGRDLERSRHAERLHSRGVS